MIDDVFFSVFQIIEGSRCSGRVREVSVPKQAVNEHQSADGEARRSKDPSQMLEFLCSGVVLGLEGLDHLLNETDLVIHPVPGHEGPLRASVGDQGAHEFGILAVAQRYFLVPAHPWRSSRRAPTRRSETFLDLEIHWLSTSPQITAGT